MFDESKMEYCDLGDSYRYYNYAKLHTNTLNHVFDTMRYDRAFFVRWKDVEKVISQNPIDIFDRYIFLLAKYDWKGATRPGWTPGRLLSSQEYEFVHDPSELYLLNADFNEFHARPTLKISTICEVEGNLSQICKTMFANRAMPSTEVDARALENCLHEPDRKITLKLLNFQAKKLPWNLTQVA